MSRMWLAAYHELCCIFHKRSTLSITSCHAAPWETPIRMTTSHVLPATSMDKRIGLIAQHQLHLRPIPGQGARVYARLRRRDAFLMGGGRTQKADIPLHAKQTVATAAVPVPFLQPTPQQLDTAATAMQQLEPQTSLSEALTLPKQPCRASTGHSSSIPLLAQLCNMCM
jgi:hypothetical protein